MLTDNANWCETRPDLARPSRHRSPERRPPAARIAWAIRALVLSLFLVSLPLGTGNAAPIAQDNILTITYPGPGSVLSGQVPIQGTATHPSFISYGLLYATGTEVTGETSWRHDNPIAWDVRTMVVNGLLGTWDTTQVPNGQYVLAVAMLKAGEDNSVYFVTNLTVNNAEATATPEPTVTPTEETPGEGEPTEEAPPPPAAATIVLPATATPRPTPTLAPNEPAAGNDSEGDNEGGLFAPGMFSVDAIKEAFVTGAQLAFLLYAVGVLYVLAKAVIRYYLRQSRRKPSS